MTSIAQVAKKMQTVFNEQANELGKASGFIKRSRRLTGASFVTALVSDWLSDGATTLNSLSQATAVGTGVSSQALDQRFTPAAAEFMRQMVARTTATVIEHEQELGILGEHFKRIYLQDSTSIQLPAALQTVWQGQRGHSSVKIHVEWEMVAGGLTQVQLTDGVTHDRRGLVMPERWEAGSLYLRDLGYFNLAEFAQMSADGCWWVTRYKSGTTLSDEHAQPFALADWLQTVGAEPQATSVLVGQQHALAARLVARRATAAETKRQRQALRDWERLKQRRASPDRWGLVGWTLYLTNLPPDKLTLAQVATLYRLRWQIERLFRLWKNELQLATWRTQNPWRMLCEFYAKLIAAVVQHWCFLIGMVHDVRSSWQRATNVIRKKAWQWANALLSFPALCQTLHSICACLQHGTRICASQSSPTTYQHLRACGLT